MQAIVSQANARKCAQYFPAPNPPALEQTGLELRPLCSDDAAGINEMHARLSLNSIYMRYLHTFKPTHEKIAQILSEAISRGGGFAAATPSGEIVGFGYYLRDQVDQRIAEPALIVEDRYQGHGIGLAMMRLLSMQAKRSGLHAFRAWVDPANRRVLQLTRKLDFPSQTRFVDGMMELRLIFSGSPKGIGS
jgi:RimJ/RimL family protein N-acetyltransferase